MKRFRISDSEDHISEIALRQTVVRLCPKGSVLIVVRSGILQRTLPVAIAEVPVTLNQDMKAIVPHVEVEPSYLAYFLVGCEREILDRCSKDGTTVASIESDLLRSFPIALPPLAEQRRIVAAIEQHFTRLDAGVGALKRAQVALKRYRAAALKAAVEGRLTEEWRREHPDGDSASALLAYILTERRARWEADLRAKGKDPASTRYDELQAPDTTSLPAQPKDWCWATIEQLAAPEPNAITDGPFGSNLKTEHYVDEGQRVIRLQNIGDGVFRDEYAHITFDHFASLAKHQVFSGDVVIAALGESPPRSCIIPESVGPAIVKADCVRLKPHRDVRAAYLNITLNAEPTRTRTAVLLHGVGRPRLNLREIKSIVLPLPPLAEQEQIVTEVERRLSVVAELEAAAVANLARAERLRQSILREAFVGRLVPQDPADEPASAVLVQLHPERESWQSSVDERRLLNMPRDDHEFILSPDLALRQGKLL